MAPTTRPLGVSALSVFSLASTALSFAAAVSLLWPEGPLEPMWRINPRAREDFAAMGAWAPAMLFAVSVACALCAVGLWLGRVWGYRLALIGFAANLIGDAMKSIIGKDPRAAIGIPVVGALIVYLTSARVRRFFYPSLPTP